MFCGNAAYELANFSGSGRASASMNDVSREHFTPAAAADAVVPTYLRATVPDFHPMYSVKRPCLCRPCYNSMPLPPGRSASCTAYPPCERPADEAGGWWSSSPASMPVPPSLRLLGHSGTEFSPDFLLLSELLLGRSRGE